ncbi:MAG: hypothetical protein Q8T09_00175 [Candidatus Melainabacteria bacterium]|nr:hypothetical protein [Candidatus Melainabacteria bacterium]
MSDSGADQGSQISSLSNCSAPLLVDNNFASSSTPAHSSNPESKAGDCDGKSGLCKISAEFRSSMKNKYFDLNEPVHHSSLGV